MNRHFIWIACLSMAAALTVTAPKASARTDVSFDIRIGDPYRGPSLAFRSEPRVVVVPGTRVYYVRDYDYDLYRYGSYWYYNHNGGWYRSRRYNGPFTYIGYRAVPRQVTYVPVRYRKHWREARDERYYRTESRRDRWDNRRDRWDDRRDRRDDRRDRRDDRRDRRDDRDNRGRGRGN